MLFRKVLDSHDQLEAQRTRIPFARKQCREFYENFVDFVSRNSDPKRKGVLLDSLLIHRSYVVESSDIANGVHNDIEEIFLDLGDAIQRYINVGKRLYDEFYVGSKVLPIAENGKFILERAQETAEFCSSQNDLANKTCENILKLY